MSQTLSDDLQTPDGDIMDGAQEDVFVFPASFGQRRLWFLDQFEPNSPYYNIPSAVRLTGSLDAEVLQRALNEIVRRHETLRTTFADIDGQPMQIIAPYLALSLPVTDLRHLPQAEREAEALRLATEEARRPFDLGRGPLLRVGLLRMTDDEHIVLLTMHHIISDGWSVGVLINEIAALYTAFSADRPSPLPELPIQYADFAEWQRQWLTGDIMDRQIAYWKRHLGGELPVLELPTDRPRPAVITSRGSSQSLKLPQRLTQELMALSRREGATLFMTLLAAFQTLLHRYSGQNDICVGTPIANRNRGELEGLIGLFINTLVIRSDLAGNPTFRQLIRRVREVTLEAYAHQDLPFEQLVEALQPDRDMSHSPLFQVMFILQNAPVKAQALPGLNLSMIEVDSGTATFDLTLSMSEDADGLDASIEYNTDLFDAATITRMLKHFQTLLEGIVASESEQPIAMLPLLTEAERHQLLVEWNDTAADYPRDECVHHLFEAQAAQSPNAVAVVHQDQRLTYAELNQRANQLAHFLHKMGVGPETVIGICVERSPKMIVGVLGILKVGGAYLPLDPLYPPERLSFMLQDSGVRLLLTQTRLADSLAGYVPQLICLDEDWPSIARESDANPPHQATPDNLAYLIYTSGSTGQSKGVMIEHRNLVNAYRAWESAYRLDSVSSHLQMANFAFDVFSGDLVRALCSGAKLVVCPREFLLDPPRLYALMRRETVDCAEFVPAVLRHLIQHLEQTRQNLDFMQLLICGSDSWYVGEYWKFRRVCGSHTRLINSFGLTEATIDSSFFESGALELGADQVVPIGRPFVNTQLYILDEQLQPVPIGVQGELYVGGAGVARGYLNRPELTAERFITMDSGQWRVESTLTTDHSPLATRLYKTGDRARFLPDGNIEFLGRADHQVKIRGFRIEPGEIEAVLGQHPTVRQAVVMPQEAPGGDKRLVAYVVPDGSAPAPGELRRFVQERLPDYMTPSAFMLLESLPITPNGKIDRQALPLPDWSHRELEDEYVAPRTPIEQTLAGIWAQVLGLKQVGIHDDFFELGGHSLLATQLVSRVREAFQIDLPLRNVFESSTVATLAERIELATQIEAGVLAPPMQPVSRDRDLPLSFAQQRLWFLDQLEPDSPFYNLPEALRLTGSLNVAALEKSLNEIVQRHEVLRTTFATVDGKPKQVIAPKLGLSLPVVDLRRVPQAEREAEAQRLASEEVQRSFDLARGPVLRARLLRMGDEDHIALLTMHHICGDDWSTTVLIQEMAVLYDAFANGRPSPLPELAIQYADFAHWQREWLQGETLERQLAYWKHQLGGSPPILELPTDRPRPAAQTFRGDYQSFVLPPHLSQALKHLSRLEGATLFMTLLAAFQTLLYRYTGSEDISVGTPIANRNRAEIEGLIGFFVNTLVMRADLSGEPGFRELIKRVREVALGAYTHQDVPFEMIVDALQPKRDLSHSPLFQVMFVIQNSLPSSQQIASGLTLSPVDAHSGTAKFDLTLFMVEEAEDRLSGALEYNTDLFDAATIARLLKHFETLLEGITADPDQPISTLPLLTQAERHQLLVEWNDTAADYPHDRCAHHLFEAQVERTPDAIAAVFEERRLTYRELNERANQLAHYLQRLGVEPETLVGICIERTLDMPVGLLGVLKAGGAYVPLDPTYPAERLAFMLQDSRVPVLLTQARLLPLLPAHSAHVVRLDADWDIIAQERADNVDSGASAENLAYVIYTSGSTGKPKGALIHHRGLVNYLTWCQRAYPLNAGQGAPVHSSISFDLTVTALFAPLTTGCSVTILPEDLGVETLSQAMRHATDFSLVKITPAHLQLLGQQLSPQEAPNRTRAFIIGGENLLHDHVAFWTTHAPDTLLINEYGPTETVVGCCVYQAPRGDQAPGSIPIGRPIINTQLYVLDRHLQPAPIGVPGELYIGGAGVARGYLNRPDLTAERFIENPFGKDKAGLSSYFSLHPSSLLYKTGDLVRYRPDGNLEYLGRIDDQVKIRGFRVELGEVEAVLSQHPALREVAIVARDDTGGKRLVAYITPAGEGVAQDEMGRVALTSRLRDFLKAKLPEYMVPSAFVLLDALPLTPNGKVDRRALPAPEQSRPELKASYTAPHTPTEEILAGIWSQLLGLRQVGVHDDFFELGGDSILSIQVISRAGQAGLRLTPKQLFEHPTVAGLAAVAEKGPAVQAEQGIVEGPLPLIPIQRWFFDLNVPEPQHWNQSLLFEVRRPLDRALLKSAVAHLLAHHDALRLQFERTPQGWQQTNATAGDDVPVAWIDLSRLSETDQQQAIETHTNALQVSLNLSAGPVLRMAYFNLGNGRSARLLMIVHQLVVDRVSWSILLADLLTAYQQLSQGQTVRLPLKTTSFREWAHRLETYARSEAICEELGYWLKLSSHALTRLPVDSFDSENIEASARSLTLSLDAEATRGLLQDVPRAYRADVDEALLATLAQVIERWSGSRELWVDIERQGRDSPFEDVDLTRSVGWFATRFPVRLDLGNYTHQGDALKAVKEQLRSIPRRGIGYGLLRYFSRDEEIVRQLQAIPQPEVIFGYLGEIDPASENNAAFEPAQGATGPERSPNGKRSHLIGVAASIHSGQLNLEWSYSETMHQHETIERLAQDFVETLRSLVAHCQAAEESEYSPSDFTEFGWSQSDLDDIIAQIDKSS